VLIIWLCNIRRFYVLTCGLAAFLAALESGCTHQLLGLVYCTLSLAACMWKHNGCETADAINCLVFQLLLLLLLLACE
jgi:hypothetical protein